LNECTVAAVEISVRKDLNTLYKFRNLISVNRIFIKDYKVSVSIWHIRSESRVTFEMPQLSDLQKCVWLRDGVNIRAIAREINVDNVWMTFWKTSLSIPFTKLKVWRCQSVWVFNGRNCTYIFTLCTCCINKYFVHSLFYHTIKYCRYSWLQKKTGNENFPNVNFGFVHLSINCQLDNTCQIIF
jgi:hypothetical protein